MKRIILQLLAGLAGIFLLLLMALLVLLRTDWGHNQLERGLNQVLAKGEQEIRINDLQGALPFELGLGELTISDAQGKWLQLRDLQISWSLRDILQRRILVDQVRGLELRVLRAPLSQADSKPEPEDKEPADFAWPLQPGLGVDLEELEIARLSLGPELAGTEAVFRLQAAMALDRAGELEAELDLQGLDRPGLLLQAKAGYQAKPEEDVELDINFQDQGLLQDLLPEQGVPEDISFQLAGEGQGSSWQGKAELDAPGLSSLDMDLDLQLREGIGLDFQGELQASPKLVPEQFQAFLRKKSKLQGSILFEPQEARLHLEGLQLEAPGLQGNIQAGADLEHKTVQGNLQLQLLDPESLLAKSGLKTDYLQLKAVFSGPWARPETKLDLETGRVKGKDFSLQGLNLESEISLQEGPGMQLGASGQGSLQGLEVAGLSQARDLNLEYALQLQQKQLLMSLFQVQTDRDVLQARDLQLDLDALEFASKVDLKLNDLQAWMQGEDLPQAGLELESELQGNLQDLDLQAEFRGRIQELAGMPEQVLDLTGPGIDLSGSLDLEQGKRLSVSKLQLQGREFSLLASGALQLQEMLLQADLDLDLPRLQASAEHLPLGLSGGVKLKAGLQGALPGLDADIELQSRDLVLEDKDLQLDLRLQARDVLQNPQGSLDMALAAWEEELRLQTQYALQGNSLQMADLRLHGAGAELDADLNLDLQGLLVSGQAQGRVQELSRLAALAGVELQGRLALESELYSRDGSQQGSLNLHLEQLQSSGADLGRLESELEFRDLMQGPRVQGEFSLEELQAGDLELSELGGDLAWSGQDLSLDASGRGSLLHPLQLDLGLVLEPGQEGKGHILALQRLQGKYREQDFHLQDPLQVEISQQEISWQELNLQYGEASLSTQGSLGQEELDGFLHLQGLRLQDLPLKQTEKLQGNLEAQLDFAGSGAEPRLQGQLNLSQLRTLDLAEKDVSGLQADIGLSYEQGRLQVQSQASAGEGNTSTLSLDLPLRLSLQPFAAALRKEQSLQGKIQAEAQLSHLGYVLLPEGQLLQGRMLLDADLGGALQSPKVQGELSIKDGSFEQPAQGILLQDLMLDADLEGKRAQLELEASDGMQGSLKGHGAVDLSRPEDLSWSMDLDLSNFRALNSKDVQAWLQKGSIELQGDAKGGSLQGKLEFDRVQAMVPKGGSADIVHLDYTQKESLQNGNNARAESKDSGPGFALDLDLKLEFPARVYVRGRGLDSEWRGNLRVSGDTLSPRMTGKLQVARGHMMFLNKRFTLDQDSNITFTGASPPAPVLNITARHKRKDLEGIVRVTGLVQDLQLELDSEPPMSQDQILARILFGRDITQISPFQAVMLANAARSLATGGGMDLMGQVRTMLNVDSIDVQTDQDTGEVQFGLGKYVHERVYLEVEKGTEPGSDQVRVEMELTPRLNLESSLESEGQGGVGLFWKLDY